MNFKRTIAASAIMIVTIACVSYLSHGETIQPHKPFSMFPKTIGDWNGKEDRFDQKVYEILGVDDSFLATFVNPEGRHVQLYIGYYGSQREGDLIHSPKHCMPGSGWNITQTSTEELEIPGSNPGKIESIKLLLEKGSQRQIVLYWFQSRGRFIASEYMQKIYLVLDSIFRQRTDGSFVRLISPIVGDDDKDTIKTLKDFTKLVIPVLEEYIPS